MIPARAIAASSPTRLDLVCRLGDYLSLAKPRIVILLDFTAVAAMFPAARGLPATRLVLAVALGGALAAAGAHAINCWYDRDIDALMPRTASRPLPSGRIPASHAIVLGVVLNAIAFVLLWSQANLAAALLALAGSLVYVFVYTIWLKRSSPQNIVIGGAAGAIPPLVGWAAVTGGVDLTAVALFLVVLCWTPPHFWALAQIVRNHYDRAGVPMLPSVLGAVAAKRRSLAYAAMAAAVSLVPATAGGRLSLAYLATASGLGLGLIAACWLDLSRPGWTRRLFAYSVGYLAALFALVALQPFLP